MTQMCFANVTIEILPANTFVTPLEQAVDLLYSLDTMGVPKMCGEGVARNPGITSL